VRLDDGPAAGEELDHQHHQGQEKHDVNVGAENMEADPAKQPQDKKNYEDGPEHSLLLREINPLPVG
jgi:hypothetical protein